MPTSPKMSTTKYVYDQSHLFLAVKKKNYKDVERLLEYHRKWSIGLDELEESFWRAIKDDDDRLCKLFFKQGAYTQVTDDIGETLVHRTVRGNAHRIVETLLRVGAPVNAQTKRGATPLHYAVEHSDAKMCQLLLDYGADPSICAGMQRNPPLYLAAVYSKHKIARKLLEGHAEVNKKNGQDKAPLHVACEADDKEMVEILLGFGADPTIPGYHDGTTPMFLCFRTSNSDVPEQLAARKILLERRYLNCEEPLKLTITDWDDKISSQIILDFGPLESVNKTAKKNPTPTGPRDRFFEIYLNLKNFTSFKKDFGKYCSVNELYNKGWTYGGYVLMEPTKPKNAPGDVDNVGSENQHTSSTIINLKTGRAESPPCVNNTNSLPIQVSNSPVIGQDYDVSVSSLLYLTCCEDFRKMISNSCLVVNKLNKRFGFDKRFLEHVIMLKVADLIDEDTFSELISKESMDPKLVQFQSKCEKEVEKMKVASLQETTVTFYNILTWSPTKSDPVMTKKNYWEIVKNRSWNSIFPIYEDMIIWQAKKARMVHVALNKIHWFIEKNEELKDFLLYLRAN